MDVAAPKSPQAQPLPVAPAAVQNRIYYPTQLANTWKMLSGVVSVLLGLAFSLVVYGGVNFTALSVFFVGGQLLVWLVVPSYQFGDDTFNIIWRTHTRKIPYEQFAPHLFRSEMSSGDIGTKFIYQFSPTQERELFIPLHPTPPLMAQFLRRCGIRKLPNLKNQARASSPDITPQELLELASSAPKETLENPALLLFSLEDPNLYRNIQAAAIQSIFLEELQFKTEGHQRLVLSRAIRWIIEKKGLELGEIKQRCVDAYEQLALGRISHRQFEKTIRQIEAATRNRGVVTNNNPPGSLTTIFWLHRWTMYDDPTQTMRAMLTQWQKLEPHLHTEFFASEIVRA